jgi:hypothetical protein
MSRVPQPDYVQSSLGTAYVPLRLSDGLSHSNVVSVSQAVGMEKTTGRFKVEDFAKRVEGAALIGTRFFAKLRPRLFIVVALAAQQRIRISGRSKPHFRTNQR